MMRDPAADAMLDVYECHGVAWTRLRGERLRETGWLDRFCALLPPGGPVLDIGCGSGVPIARELVGRGFAVTGVDGSAKMPALAAENLPGVSAIRADMRGLAIGHRFDGLLAWDSFFHLSPEDQRPIFARLAGHAAPGAARMFTSGPAEGSAIGELEVAPLNHGSLSVEEYRVLLDTAVFDVVDQVAEDADCGGRTVWLARRR